LIGNILKKQAKDTLKKMIKEAGKSLGITLISATIGAVDALAGILFDFSIGYAIAHLVDWADGNYNGICFG